MSEGPKLYNNKPKKAHLKQFQDQQVFASAAPSSSTMHSSTPPPPPPPQLPKESFARRYKFLWPMLLAVNLGVGAYLFMRTKKKETDVEEEITTAVSSVAQTTATEKPMPQPAITEPVKMRELISEEQQREAFKWILEEKRKVKPNNPEEKKRIDEEKALLKQFIRAKSLPTF
ncbi:PREDICTED: uncharacterized protein LOC101297430 [Fragaria vesca subsp. vesca]|uniref:uncharacterized protein LOC101297430 n=1 Tax=Fragaria vesca subsp. vesca TaxID=101020 RepID=UPI0002C36569|nr:PREDICTED: uncharacterized protein LOC101297430 [Fragaria vesca subsp. vesca]